MTSKDVSQRVEPVVEGEDTSGRILREASLLFSTRGYFGTSTRMIAAAVNVQQPSLYNHFASKADILQELLRLDLDPAMDALERIESTGASPAACLYCYLRWDLDRLNSSSFELRGVYDEAVRSRTEFEVWRVKLNDLYAGVEQLVSMGVNCGEFLGIPPSLARAMIHGIEIGHIREHGTRTIEDHPDAGQIGASFVLRALLVDPRALKRVQDDAAKVARAAGLAEDDAPEDG